MPSARILLTEDEPALRNFYTRVLTDAGYTVTPVPDAETAWTHLTQAPFDLLLTDYFLPGMTGADLIARLHTNGMTLPTLLMSSDPGTESCASTVQATGWLWKSPNVGALLTSINTVLHTD